MTTRMDKYYKEDTLEESRTTKNKDIYTKVNEEDFENLELTSNISIIDADTTNLDIEKLKLLLEEKYSKPKRSSREVEEIELQDEKDLEDTKEYDLKKVIDEAHKNKSSDYDKERFKKLRDTQFDILNSLNLERSEEPIVEESLTVEEANLMNLIKTVNENSLKREQISSSEDLLSDLKGENTDVLAPLDFDEDGEQNVLDRKPTLVEEIEKTKQLNKKEILSELHEEKLAELEEKENFIEDEEDFENETVQEEFYTGKYQIEDKDLDEFSDLQKEISSGNALIKALVALLILIILVIGVFLLNKYMNLGLF